MPPEVGLSVILLISVYSFFQSLHALESIKRVQAITGKSVELYEVDLLDAVALNNVFEGVRAPCRL